MCMSIEINELATALAQAQAELEPADKNSVNPHLKNRYADIAAVYEAIRKVLPKYGLSVVQTIIPREDPKVHLKTMLLHKSGQYIDSEIMLTPQQNTPQGVGSALTYARRYSLSALVGVVADDDDDGNAASKKTDSKPLYSPSKQEKTPATFKSETDPRSVPKPTQPPKPNLEPNQEPVQAQKTYNLDDLKFDVLTCNNYQELQVYWTSFGFNKQHPQYEQLLSIFNNRKAELAPADKTSSKITSDQTKAIQTHYSKLNKERTQRLSEISDILGKKINSITELTKDEASQLIEHLNNPLS